MPDFIGAPVGLSVRLLPDTRHRFDGLDHVAMFRRYTIPHIGKMIGEHGGHGAALRSRLSAKSSRGAAHRFSFAASGLELVAAGHPCWMADMKPRHAALALSDWYLT